MKVSKNNKKM